jgi:hypothetical protein
VIAAAFDISNNTTRYGHNVQVIFKIEFASTKYDANLDYNKLE